MDISIHPDGRAVYLPPELVDRIVSHLHASTPALLACRLTSKSLSVSATAVLIQANNPTSPSEFLTYKALDNKQLKSVRAKADQSYYGQEPKPMSTVWTWLQIPEDVTIEDPYSNAGLRWAKLLGDFRTSSEQIVDVWGRLHERKGAVCLVHRFFNNETLIVWQASGMLHKLCDFLEKIAPGCVATSTSEHIMMGPRVTAQPIFMPGYREIRTIYFKATMTDRQKKAVKQCKAFTSANGGARPSWLRNDQLHRHPNRIEPDSIERAWLPGVRGYKSQFAVALRFFFEWYSPSFEAQWLAEGRVEGRSVVEQFEEDLMAAGMVGYESVHANFESTSARWIMG